MKLKKLKENNDNIILSLKNEIKQITDKMLYYNMKLKIYLFKRKI